MYLFCNYRQASRLLNFFVHIPTFWEIDLVTKFWAKKFESFLDKYKIFRKNENSKPLISGICHLEIFWWFPLPRKKTKKSLFFWFCLQVMLILEQQLLHVQTSCGLIDDRTFKIGRYFQIYRFLQLQIKFLVSFFTTMELEHFWLAEIGHTAWINQWHCLNYCLELILIGLDVDEYQP